MRLKVNDTWKRRSVSRTHWAAVLCNSLLIALSLELTMRAQDQAVHTRVNYYSRRPTEVSVPRASYSALRCFIWIKNTAIKRETLSNSFQFNCIPYQSLCYFLFTGNFPENVGGISKYSLPYWNYKCMLILQRQHYSSPLKGILLVLASANRYKLRNKPRLRQERVCDWETDCSICLIPVSLFDCGLVILPLPRLFKGSDNVQLYFESSSKRSRVRKVSGETTTFLLKVHN